VRFLCALLILGGCATPQPPPPPLSRTALKGVALTVPSPEDARPSQSAGCGQFAPEMPRRVEKAVVSSLTEAGAEMAVQAPWVLGVAVTFAGAGAEYTGSQKTPLPTVGVTREDSLPPQLAEPRGGVNAGWTDTSVALDATLKHDGRVIWQGTITGHATSVPCIDAPAKLEEALQEAVAKLRTEVIRRIAMNP
jgi:hypothetical protein